jgi:hypothetical protein
MGIQGRASVTSLNESNRQQEGTSGFTGPQDRINIVTGIIHEVNSNFLRFVKVHDTTGLKIAGDNWIELSHSAQEIAERWGTVRVGFKVRVIVAGINGSNGASATIIGTEVDKVDEPPTPNSSERGLFSIFRQGG